MKLFSSFNNVLTKFNIKSEVEFVLIMRQI